MTFYLEHCILLKLTTFDFVASESSPEQLPDNPGEKQRRLLSYNHRHTELVHCIQAVLQASLGALDFQRLCPLHFYHE